MQKLTGFFKLIRIDNLLIIALGLSLFYYFVIVPVHLNTLLTTLVPFNTREFVLFVLSVVLLAAGGNVINDYFDFELDKEFKPERPLATGAISLNSALYLHMALVFSSIGLGFYLGWINSNTHIVYVYVISAILLYLYSSFLKKIPLAGNVVIAGLSAFVFMLLVIFEVNFLNAIHANHLFETTPYAFAIIMMQMKFYAGFAFLTSLARELVKDIEDHTGDEAYRINTFAVQYGDTATKWLVAVILMVLIGLLAYFIIDFYKAQAIKDALYLGIAVVLPALITLVLIITAKEAKQYYRVSGLIKLIMVLGILSIPAFYYFHQTAS